MKTHPDRGGTPTAFQQVSIAFRIISLQVPFHPEWMIPIIPSTSSCKKIGTQSAVLIWRNKLDVYDANKPSVFS